MFSDAHLLTSLVGLIVIVGMVGLVGLRGFGGSCGYGGPPQFGLWTCTTFFRHRKRFESQFRTKNTIFTL